MEPLIIEETSISSILHNLAAHITTHNAQLTDMGLLSGKTGLAIFLFHYGRCYNNASCTQLASDLIEYVRANMNKMTSTVYDNGLSGVDAGLKYLLKNGFIDTALAEMPQVAEKEIYKSLSIFPRVNIHEHLYRLSGLGKYFAQDYRKRSLTTAEPFSTANRRAVLHFSNLLGLLDLNLVPQLHHKGILRMMDVLSRIYMTGYMEREIRRTFPSILRALETTFFGNANFKPFTGDCNPFCIALSILQIYERTTKPDFASLAIRLLEEYEGAVSELYRVKDTPDNYLLQHAIACKKLHTVLKDDCFKNYADESLELYLKRKCSIDPLKYDEQYDLSLQDGCTQEGMALLTLTGCVQGDWLEDLM